MRIGDWSSDVCSSDLLLPVDFDALGLHRLGEVANRDRAVELAAVARLADERHAHAVDPAGDALGLAPTLEVHDLEIGALLLELLEIDLGRAERLLLRQKEVAEIGRAHV